MVQIPYAEALKIIRTEHAQQLQELEECFASESSDDNDILCTRCLMSSRQSPPHSYLFEKVQVR